VEIGFPEALLIVGVLLLVAASLSGLMHGTVLGENRDDSPACACRRCWMPMMAYVWAALVDRRGPRLRRVELAHEAVPVSVIQRRPSEPSLVLRR
jgi:hypothetical protein